MAREFDLIRERRNSEPITREITESTHIDGIKDVVINFLRDYFSRDPIYTYVEDQEIGGPDFENTEIVITDVYSYDIRFLPAVTLRINSVPTQWIGFTQSPFQKKYDYAVTESGEFVRDEKNRLIPIYEERSGAFNSTLSIKVSALETISREELMNRLHIAFVEVGRDFLYTQGVFVNGPPSVGGENESEFYNDYIYEQTLEVPLYTEWVRRIPLPLDKLQSIAINQSILAPDNLEVVGEHMTSAGDQIGTSTNTEGDRTIFGLRIDQSAVENAPTLTPPDIESLLDTLDDLILFDPINEEWRITEYWINLVESVGVEFTNLKDYIEGEAKLNTIREESQKASDYAKQAYIEGVVEQKGKNLLTGDIVLPGNKIYIRQADSGNALVLFRDDPRLQSNNIDVELDPINLDIIEIIYTSKNRYIKARPDAYGSFDLFADSEVPIPSRVDMIVQGSSYASMTPEDLFIILVHGRLTSDTGPLQMFGSGVVDDVNEPRFVNLEYTFSQVMDTLNSKIADLEDVSGSFAEVAKNKLVEIKETFTTLSLKVIAINSSFVGYSDGGELRPL